MKSYLFFGVTFVTSFFAMVIFSETLWVVPICLAAMIISFICGALSTKELRLMQLFRLDGITVEFSEEQRNEFYRCLTLVSRRLETLGNSSIDKILKG